MPALRGGAPLDGESRTGTVEFHSRLPLRSRRTTLPFLRDTMRLRASLEAAVESGGLIGYELGADLVRNVYTTDSRWTDEAAFTAWVASEPHRSIMTKYRGRLGMPTFERRTVGAPVSPSVTSEEVGG